MQVERQRLKHETMLYQALAALILTPVIYEFHFDGPFLSLATNIGLLVGAVFWGLGCDIWGRRSVSRSSHLAYLTEWSFVFQVVVQLDASYRGCFRSSCRWLTGFCRFGLPVCCRWRWRWRYAYTCSTTNRALNSTAGNMPVDSAVFLGK